MTETTRTDNDNTNIEDVALHMGYLAAEHDRLNEAITEASSDERPQLEHRQAQVAVEVLDCEIALMEERLREAVSKIDLDPSVAPLCRSLASGLEELHASRANAIQRLEHDDQPPIWVRGANRVIDALH